MRQHRRRNSGGEGFTLVELLVVICVLAITAAVVVPMMTGTSDLVVAAGSRMVTADIQYAQNVAITSQDPTKVTFNTDANSYVLSSNASGTLKHPMTKRDYIVQFGPNSAYGCVNIQSASFGGGAEVTFDELGAPCNGGSVVLQAGPFIYTINVTPVTGTVTVAR